MENKEIINEEFEDTMELDEVLKIAQILNSETEDIENYGIID